MSCPTTCKRKCCGRKFTFYQHKDIFEKSESVEKVFDGADMSLSSVVKTDDIISVFVNSLRRYMSLWNIAGAFVNPSYIILYWKASGVVKQIQKLPQHVHIEMFARSLLEDQIM